MKRNIGIIICFIVISAISIGVRLYHLSSPIADWHSWRQVDTAAVARNFLTFGVDTLHPRYDDLSNIQSGKDNPQGYRMVEFPLYQAAAAELKLHVGMVSIEVWLRILSIIASTVTGIALGILLWRRINAMTGLIAASMYAILPYSMYYGRTILPDVPAVCFAVVALLLFDIASEKKDMGQRWILVLASAIFSALALLAKPVAGFLLIPVGGMFFSDKKISIQKLFQGIVYVGITLFPLYLWRKWMLQYPEGIPVYLWLFNNGNIRFKGAWFYWIFAERIAKLILGYWGVLFVALGVIWKSEKREKWMTFLLVLGALAYITIIASGNVQHDYYQIMILPAVIAICAKGLGRLLELIYRKQEGISRFWSSVMIGVTVFFTLSFSWYTIRTYYWINHPEIIEAGKAADALLPKDAKVIAPYNGDTTFLYQTGRQGWPLGFDIDAKIKMGATTYVTVSPTDNDWETKTLAEKYTVLVRNDTYAIIDLTKPKQK